MEVSSKHKDLWSKSLRTFKVTSYTVGLNEETLSVHLQHNRARQGCLNMLFGHIDMKLVACVIIPAQS